jgi:hypothetical protein
MNNEFLKNLADHEEEMVKNEKSDGERLLIFSGARLNWIGDYLGNPKLKWKEQVLDLEELEFTGNDEFLIKTCERSPQKFQEMVLADPELKSMYQHLASDGNETILVRNSDHDYVKYKILDGAHRVIGACLNNQKTIRAMVPQNEKEVLPYCEAHTVYDLIRGFLRHRRSEDGEIELYNALKLLIHTYANVRDLLENRFNYSYVNNERVQLIIGKVLNNESIE